MGNCLGLSDRAKALVGAQYSELCEEGETPFIQGLVYPLSHATSAIASLLLLRVPGRESLVSRGLTRSFRYRLRVRGSFRLTDGISNVLLVAPKTTCRVFKVTNRWSKVAQVSEVEKVLLLNPGLVC